MAEPLPVWVIDDDHAMRWVLERALTQAGFTVRTWEDAGGVIETLQHEPPAALITDIRMPGTDGLQLLEQVRTAHPQLPVILMTAHADLDAAVSAYQGGAFEYLPKPFDLDEAVAQIRRACRARTEPAADDGTDLDAAGIIGRAPAMQEVFRAIGRLSRSHATVLIEGETGTGKELVARALHRFGPRADKPFVAINTSAIPKPLLESELFGHERGAFTGAQNQRRGRFEQAHGGTLFLDEIGDMPADLQTRLLRVLSDGEFYRVGGHATLQTDVRIIAATHQDLEQRVSDGRFREDLFHRLNVIRVHVPRLAERREDIATLVEHFLGKAAAELETPPKRPRPEVLEYLTGLDWPGNVRQLENTCRWLTVMAPGREIHSDDLPRELRNSSRPTDAPDWKTALSAWAERELAKGGAAVLSKAAPLFETALIEAALKKTGGRRQEAARLLGWGRNTLTRKIKELGLHADGED